jgi:hypothetical protein
MVIVNPHCIIFDNRDPSTSKCLDNPQFYTEIHSGRL